jgi:maleate cis-trans isomerase
VPVEKDLEVPVVHPAAARVWYVQKQLRIRQLVTGASHLLAELPYRPHTTIPQQKHAAKI